ncbi:MAG: Rab family GTPase [Candidatus Helarchaeota archaeon]
MAFQFRPDVKFVFKIIIVGEPGVGKTSLIKSFIKSKFQSYYKPTIGTDLFQKTIELEGKGKTSLAIWDIAGQAKWEDFRHLYFTGARGGLVVFDATRVNTFLAIDGWIKNVKTFLPNIPIILVENKIDLLEKSLLEEKKIEELKDKYNILAFYRSSAKTGENVKRIFFELAGKIAES